MAETFETRRVAVIARGEQATALRALFQSAPLRGWEAFLAEGCEHALLDRATVRRTRRRNDQLRDCRSQVTRLVNLLWDATPAEGRPRWFSQRYMLERLQEEICRSERHGNPLSVVLGEVWIGQEDA